MRRRLVLGLIALLTLVSVMAACTGQKKASDKPVTFTNPLPDDGQGYSDPWLIRVGDHYYYIGSLNGNELTIKKSSDPTTILTKADHVVYTAPAGQAYSKELWAPELHYLAGRWYIYVAADDGDNANHRMYCLAGGTNKTDPLDGKFRFAGKIADATNKWAIDGTVMSFNHQLYMIWSGWAGDENVAQNLYIAPMSDPTTISGPRVKISSPDQSWEQVGEPHVNEGPEILKHDGKLSLIYSASGSWTDDYCLGRLALTGSDPLDPAAWRKDAKPVFAKTDQVFGPGHCSFIKSPSDEDWLVYHAAISQGSGWQRDIRMQPFTWHKNGSPDFGRPVAPGKKLTYR